MRRIGRCNACTLQSRLSHSYSACSLHSLPASLPVAVRVLYSAAAGISLKTQFLYALVFLCRYVDLFWNFASMYNWIMKVREAAERTEESGGTGRRMHCSERASGAGRSSPLIALSVCVPPPLRAAPLQIVFIVSSCAIVYLMKYQTQISTSYDRKADSFSIWYLIGPCLLLALLINDVFWRTPVPGKHVHVLTYFDYFTEVRTKKKKNTVKRGRRAGQSRCSASALHCRHTGSWVHSCRRALQ